jgi:hypothetical protein
VAHGESCEDAGERYIYLILLPTFAKMLSLLPDCAVVGAGVFVPVWQ